MAQILDIDFDHESMNFQVVDDQEVVKKQDSPLAFIENSSLFKKIKAKYDDTQERHRYKKSLLLWKSGLKSTNNEFSDINLNDPDSCELNSVFEKLTMSTPGSSPNFPDLKNSLTNFFTSKNETTEPAKDNTEETTPLKSILKSKKNSNYTRECELVRLSDQIDVEDFMIALKEAEAKKYHDMGLDPIIYN